MKNVILFAIPVFFLMIGIELWVDRKRGTGFYRLADSLASLSLGSLSQIANFFTKGVGALSYIYAYRHLALWDLPDHGWPVWLAALVLYDFCYYWVHRCGHELNIMWAAHVVHHSSEEYNLSTALRQTGTGFLLGWIFYLPMAVIGIPPMVFIGAGLINLLYQYWVHTRHIGRMGWFDYMFASPSNHRVHHGQNDYCIDRNYGGMLMLWDHLFKSFVAERDNEPIVYGIRGALASHDPIWGNLHYYASMLKAMRQAKSWRERLLMWFKPPGWNCPKADFQPADFKPYRPGFGRIGERAALCLFVLLLIGTTGFIGLAPTLPLAAAGAYGLALTGGFWFLGRRLSA